MAPYFLSVRSAEKYFFSLYNNTRKDGTLSLLIYTSLPQEEWNEHQRLVCHCTDYTDKTYSPRFSNFEGSTRDWSSMLTTCLDEQRKTQQETSVVITSPHNKIELETPKHEQPFHMSLYVLTAASMKWQPSLIQRCVASLQTYVSEVRTASIIRAISC
jgi:hypothetical protein